MDLAQAFLSVIGWVFFAAWGVILAAVSVIAFGPELSRDRSTNIEPTTTPQS